MLSLSNWPFLALQHYFTKVENVRKVLQINWSKKSPWWLWKLLDQTNTSFNKLTEIIKEDILSRICNDLFYESLRNCVYVDEH